MEMGGERLPSALRQMTAPPQRIIGFCPSRLRPRRRVDPRCSREEAKLRRGKRDKERNVSP